MKLIWHGTASVELISHTGRILFDPFVPTKHSPVPVILEEFDGFSDVLITHGHLDHIASLPAIFHRNPGMRIWCTETPRQTLCRKGIPMSHLERISYGQTLQINDFTIHVIHGRHAVLPKVSPSLVMGYLRSPARGNLPWLLRENIACPENDETVCYHIECEGKSIVLMGSLNLRDESAYPVMPDLLLLPYNGWTDNLPPAIKALTAIQPKRVLLDHYDVTFPPLTQPIDLQPILAYGRNMIAPMILHQETEI